MVASESPISPERRAQILARIQSDRENKSQHIKEKLEIEVDTQHPHRIKYSISEERRAEILARIHKAWATRDQHIDAMKEQQKVGLAIAKAAAAILKSQFNATRVVLFGSLLTPEKMYERSDIDIAVWGLNSDQVFAAQAAIESQTDCNSEFSHLDLVPAEKAFPHIKESIEKSHLEL